MNENMQPVAIKLAVVCPSCNGLVPVNGYARKVHCSRCDTGIPLQGKFGWRKLLDFGNPAIDVFKWAMTKPSSKSETGAFVSIKLEVLRKWPACSGCKKHFSKHAVRAGVSSGEPMVCEHCGKTLRAYQAPDEFRKIFPRARIIVGTAAGESVKQAAMKGGDSQPIVLFCQACGAPLGSFGEKSSIPCPFCKAENYMPPALRHQEEKPPVPLFWYVLYDPEESS